MYSWNALSQQQNCSLEINFLEIDNQKIFAACFMSHLLVCDPSFCKLLILWSSFSKRHEKWNESFITLIFAFTQVFKHWDLFIDFREQRNLLVLFTSSALNIKTFAKQIARRRWERRSNLVGELIRFFAFIFGSKNALLNKLESFLGYYGYFPC